MSARRALVSAVTLLCVVYARPLEGQSTPVRKPRPDAFTQSLEERLKTGAQLDDIEVDIRWPFEGRPASCRVYGSGVGIWDRQVQFRLSRSEVTSFLGSVSRTRLGSLRSTIGGNPTQRRIQKGQIAVSIGPVSKVVIQLEGGEQSAPLQKLADDFLRVSAAAAVKGVRVSGFADAFGKLASGKLSPEVFEVVVQRHDLHKDAAEGWTLRLQGRRASVRVSKGASAQEPERVLVLSKADFDALLRVLREGALATLPRNLYAAQNVDLRVQVLDQVCALRAGPTPGLTPTTLGASQKSFDRILAAFVALQGRVEKEGGQPSSAPGTTPRPAPNR